MNLLRKTPVSGESLFTSDPQIMGGRLIFRGTRIPADVLFDNLADGMSLDEILDAYPSLPREYAIAAIELAGTAIEEATRSPQTARP